MTSRDRYLLPGYAILLLSLQSLPRQWEPRSVWNWRAHTGRVSSALTLSTVKANQSCLRGADICHFKSKYRLGTLEITKKIKMICWDLLCEVKCNTVPGPITDEVCVYVRVCVRMCICVVGWVLICECMGVHVCGCACMWARVHSHGLLCECMFYTRVCVHVCSCVCIYVHFHKEQDHPTPWTFSIKGSKTIGLFGPVINHFAG